MFYGLLIGLHILAAILLIIIVLMQAAKGGGLSGAFGTGMGSSPLFGAATSTVLVRTTTVLAIVFAITCISIATIQSRRATVMRGIKQSQKKAATETAKEGAAAEEKEEAALSPVEGGGEKQASLSPVEAGQEKQPALSPVEAGEQEKGQAGTEREKPSELPELSPVEAEREKKEPKPAPAEPEESMSPVEGKNAAN